MKYATDIGPSGMTKFHKIDSGIQKLIGLTNRDNMETAYAYFWKVA
jgi:hypothetical protein